MCHWWSYHILTSSVIYYWTDARQRGIYLFYITKQQSTTDKDFFSSESFTITRKPAFAHFGEHEKKPFAVIYCLYKMQQSHWLLFVAKNCDHATVKLDLKVASRGMKTHSESIIELQNLQILKKYWKSQDSFCHQSSPVGRKAWMSPWILQELKKYSWKTWGCGQHWRPFDSSFEWKER